MSDPTNKDAAEQQDVVNPQDAGTLLPLVPTGRGFFVAAPLTTTQESEPTLSIAGLIITSATIFSPTLQFGGAATGITYATRSGVYSRCGPLVTIQIRLILTSKGSAAGNATISGLPIAASADCDGVMLVQAGSFTAVTRPIAAIGGGTTTITLLDQVAGSNIATITDANFSNFSDLSISLTYQV
jgi:hypothetical protein